MKRKSFSARPKEMKRENFVVDAKGKTLGRLAARVATVLRGKHKPIFTPNMDAGDNVIVINAKEIKVSGGKEKKKTYFTHSGYPGGDKLLSFEEKMRRSPVKVIEHAVRGMLPKGPLGRVLIKKLTVHADSAEVAGKPLNI